MLYNMAKDFVHANVLSTTHDIAQRASKELKIEINEVYDTAVRDLVAKHAIQIEEPEE
jgi:hypothetical protein